MNTTNAPACTRRSVLKSLAGLGLLCASSAAAPAPEADRWRLSFGLNGFESGVRKYRKNYPIWEILEFAQRHRFEGIELVSNWPAGDYPFSHETSRIASLRGLYDKYGLRIFSIQLSAGGAFDPSEEARTRWLEEFQERVKFARAVGCECVGLWPGGGLRGQTIEQAIERLGHTFRRAGELAARDGIQPSFEIEPPFVFNTEAHLRAILQAADHPNLKTIYDPSHFDLMSSSVGRPHEMLRRIGVKHIGYVHFTDCDGTLRDGGTSKHLAAGEGHIDIPASFATLREGGFRGWINMDTWEVPDPYAAALAGQKAAQLAQRS